MKNDIWPSRDQIRHGQLSVSTQTFTKKNTYTTKQYGGTNMNEKDQESIRVSKTGIWQGVSAVLVVLLAVSLLTGGFGLGSPTGNVAAEPAKNTEPAPRPPQNEPSVAAPNIADLMGDDAVKGDPDAPVTIVEWSDFECPFCARFYQQTLSQIEQEYIETGKAKLVYRDFPLSFHAQAQKAAEAAECAGEQDAYWEMHDTLFEKGVSGEEASFKQYAADLGLDTEAFNTCLDSGAMAAEVAQDMREGQAAGITGTPGFVINGQRVVGAQPFSAFKQVIDAELAKAG